MAGGRCVATIDSVLFSSLQSALTASQLSQQAYANNIANANTPGYKRQSVAFSQLLAQQLNAMGYLQGSSNSSLSMAANSSLDLSGASSTFNPVQPVVVTDSSTSTKNNGNNVDLNVEMSGLAQNQINYAALVTEMNNQFAMLRSAILGS